MFRSSHNSAAIVAISFILISQSVVYGQKTEMVSISSGGMQGNSLSGDLSISADGRFIAFYSLASNLVAGDTNGFGDVFVHDRQSGTTERVSLSSTGSEANGDCYYPSISNDGRFVSFTSNATNLVPSDVNGVEDVFVRDRLTGATEIISVSSLGVHGNKRSFFTSISGDGAIVVFNSAATNLVPGDNNSVQDVFVRDRVAGTTELVSVSGLSVSGNGQSAMTASSISTDGRLIAFTSLASNLVAGDTNSTYDSFVRDRIAGTTERVSVSSAGIQDNCGSFMACISGDGRFVAFRSCSTNLVPGDTNDRYDIFVRDRIAQTTERISVSTAGVQANSNCRNPALSADGRFVAFSTDSSNLVSLDAGNFVDIFVHDRNAHTTELASVSGIGVQADASSSGLAISADGRFVCFDSYATNLVAWDSNGTSDVFVRELRPIPFGAGTSGCAGPLTLGTTQAAMINSPNFTITCNNAPPSTLGMAVVTDSQDVNGSDPYAVGVVLYCDLQNASQVLTFDFISDANGNGQTINSGIPTAPQLIGKTFYASALWPWPISTCTLPGYNPLNLSSSGGLAITILAN